ncbi:winged helix DNA-binding domain-containing protein [Candidatus Nephthysia bennettiae]|uniref:AlkZ family DNA glycosylase n=1 Tax=Candidatus Nephthysia bennettiae TaxID=3127016 RepID=A0A934N9X6_9BACT|nr:AlkZ family DNA glycosylase [Candidatus Dormibacteraeota bacterium]MBJ7614416.1 AlkZ family DNA glycosylase [Candidatus Dormibacteraeota bacterium]
MTPAQLTWDQILAWRLRRQYLEAPAGSAIDVVRRLCGVQAQVASAAELAVGVRLPPRSPGAVARAIEERALIKTWAMRGTLHLLPADMAGAYLALIGSLKTWESPSWQKAFISAPQIEMLAEIAGEVLEGRTLSRDDLVAEVQARSHDARLAEHLRSGWAAVLKPLAWRGLLCQGPAEGNRVTFTSPRTWSPAWGGIPDQDEAARIAIPAYLGAYGPASMNAFDAWLTRGASSKRSLREWFTAAGDLLTAVEVDGERAFARSEDLEDMMGTTVSGTVRLLPAFDQYLLGPGTGDSHVVPPAHRRAVSRTAGRIVPVLVVGGRVVGTFETRESTLEITVFEDSSPVPAALLEAETARISQLMGKPLTLAVRAGP